MTPNPATMTVQECCDWVATEVKWRCTAIDDIGQRTFWINEAYNGCKITGRTTYMTPDGFDCHPFQPTLDLAAAAMPSVGRIEIATGFDDDGKVWCISKAFLRNGCHVASGEAVQMDSMIEAMKLAAWRLVVACMLAVQEGSK